MTKTITISFSDWVYDTYLSEYAGNRSKYIEGLFVRGFENAVGETDTTKQRLVTAVTEIKEKNEQIKRLKAELNKYSKNELSEEEKMNKALLNAGILRGDL